MLSLHFLIIGLEAFQFQSWNPWFILDDLLGIIRPWKASGGVSLNSPDILFLDFDLDGKGTPPSGEERFLRSKRKLFSPTSL